MLPQNSRSLQFDNQNDPGEAAHLITRRSIVLGMLVALVSMAALMVAVLGTLFSMLSPSS